MTSDDVETDLETFFNHNGLPNATPEGADAEDDFGNTYPTFLDPLVIRNPDLRRLWDLPMAARYLCFRGNPDETYVSNPDGSLLDSLLDSRSPDSGVTMDPGDPSTYASDAIIVPDFPATGKPWPVALDQLLEPNGFGMVFRLESDANGNPSTRLDIFRRQDGSPYSYKDLYLQLSGEPLDPAQTNLSQARLAPTRPMSPTSSLLNQILYGMKHPLCLHRFFGVSIGRRKRVSNQGIRSRRSIIRDRQP